jgi:hypothetical protein
MKQLTPAFVPFLLLHASLFLVCPQKSGLKVYIDRQNNTHVESATGKNTIIAREPGQAGIDEVKVLEDKEMAGWFVLYQDPDGGSPFAGKLVVWRDGRIIRGFLAEQTFWSWTFEHNGEQVAFHAGPNHGETNSHCELHDVTTGRKLATWDGDLESSDKPAWTQGLDH